MYVLAPRKGRSNLSFPASRLRGNDKTGMTTFYIFYLSMLRYCVLLVSSLDEITHAKPFKVVIASGLTSSHSEQRS